MPKSDIPKERKLKKEIKYVTENYFIRVDSAITDLRSEATPITLAEFNKRMSDAQRWLIEDLLLINGVQNDPK